MAFYQSQQYNINEKWTFYSKSEKINKSETERKTKRKESKEKEETVHGATTIRRKVKANLGKVSFYLTVLELSK